MMNIYLKTNLLPVFEKLSNRTGLIASFASVLAGIAFGSCVYNLPDISCKNELLSLFIDFSTEITDKTYIEIFSGIVISGVLYFISMFILGGNVFGKELSLLATAVKALGIGALISFLYYQHGVEGFEYALLIFLPGKFVLIFAMLFFTECCFNVSEKLRSGFNNEDTKLLIKMYTFKSIVAFGIMFISWLIDFLCLIGFSKLISFT